MFRPAYAPRTEAFKSYSGAEQRKRRATGSENSYRLLDQIMFKFLVKAWYLRQARIALEKKNFYGASADTTQRLIEISNGGTSEMRERLTSARAIEALYAARYSVYTSYLTGLVGPSPTALHKEDSPS